MKESDEDFTHLQTLLRLKRYETPPPGNVESFLYEFHRRQRAELVRRPLWRIALDRLENLLPMPVFSTPRLAYAGAAVAAVSLAGVGVLSRGPAVAVGGGAAKPTIAQVVKDAPSRRAPINLTPNSASVHLVDTDSDIENDPRFSTVPTSRLNAPRRDDNNNALRPRYVLESQPVRYEPRSSTF